MEGSYINGGGGGGGGVCGRDAGGENIASISLLDGQAVYTESFFNTEALKNVLKRVWKLMKGIVIKDIEWNLFNFQFFSKADMEFALDEGPWAFDHSTLLLKQIQGTEQLSRRSSSRRLGTGLRHMMFHDSSRRRLLQNSWRTRCDKALLVGVDRSINFQVDLDITKPLKRGICVKSQDKLIWITFKYVKLADFCYVCGLLEHTYKGCEMYDGATLEVELQYASPLKSKRCNAELELLEEQKLLGPSIGVERTRELELDWFLIMPIASQLGDYKGVYSDSRGRAGGLVLQWKKTISVTLLSNSSNHIDVEVEGWGEIEKWRFTGVCGWLEANSKTRTCELLKNLQTHSALPWLIGGDLNESPLQL
ncbi:hypothetical protein Cgig2_006909 [Carnegiea gigantea]|uniref:DUF4283 domain-containing protein n=1 Tax=Carnegiea gigantea TaxID=171969 RepID=A0A9Q1K405_9CARY|nr:hypothetical protein Cgig2_006909 [Carnegiea gigantea]